MNPLPPWESAIEAVAHRLAERADDLPDITVLLPTMQVAPALRERTLERLGRPAMLGPRCVSLATLAGGGDRGWRHRARLTLFAALRDHPGLVAGGDTWQLVESVVELFESLERAGRPLPAAAEFDTAVARGYGIAGGHVFARRESRLVATLWEYWRDAAGDADLTGTGRACAALRSMRDRGRPLFVVADELPAPVRAEIDAAIAADADVEVFWTGPGHAAVAPDATEALFDSATGAGTLDHRATAATLARAGEPTADAVSFAPADGREHEARVVELALRRARIELGARAKLVLVTEDRRLARRVRALLARDGVELRDPGGWALSTTSAAAAIERWLEAVEDDFRHGPLLDFLKSAFCALGEDLDAQRHDAWLFERYIVRMEGASSGLRRYRAAIAARAERSDSVAVKERRAALAGIVDAVERAAAPLRTLVGRRAFTAAAALDALTESLELAGTAAALDADAAGERVLDEIGALREAAHAAGTIEFDWRAFRTWLGRAFEQATFTAAGSGAVHLRNLATVADERFDFAVFAGLDAGQFPGRPRHHPFFNDSVRRELGLEDRRVECERSAWRFRRALSVAPRRLLSWCRERDGEVQVPCPWVDRMRTLYTLAWGDPAVDPCVEWARNPDTLVAHDDGSPTPVPPTRPAPAARPMPLAWSVSAHQQLIDCPYRFFAAQSLALEAPEDIAEEMSAQEFGTLVHRCLERFRSDDPTLPGRDIAIEALRRVTDEVFARREASNFEDEGLVRAWRRSIPAFVDWELERAASGARVVAVEQRRTGEDAQDIGGVRLTGKIDRIDSVDGGVSVIDYKTGPIPTRREIETGEDVQCASYALLQTTGTATTLEYVGVVLGPRDAGPRHVRVADAGPLVERVGERLHALAAAVTGGAPLPANGDARTCARCEFSVLCRRDAWHAEAADG